MRSYFQQWPNLGVHRLEESQILRLRFSDVVNNPNPTEFHENRSSNQPRLSNPAAGKEGVQNIAPMAVNLIHLLQSTEPCALLHLFRRIFSDSSSSRLPFWVQMFINFAYTTFQKGEAKTVNEFSSTRRKMASWRRHDPPERTVMHR